MLTSLLVIGTNSSKSRKDFSSASWTVSNRVEFSLRFLPRLSCPSLPPPVVPLSVCCSMYPRQKRNQASKQQPNLRRAKGECHDTRRDPITGGAQGHIQLE